MNSFSLPTSTTKIQIQKKTLRISFKTTRFNSLFLTAHFYKMILRTQSQPTICQRINNFHMAQRIFGEGSMRMFLIKRRIFVIIFMFGCYFHINNNRWDRRQSSCLNRQTIRNVIMIFIRILYFFTPRFLLFFSSSFDHTSVALKWRNCPFSIRYYRLLFVSLFCPDFSMFPTNVYMHDSFICV